MRDKGGAAAPAGKASVTATVAEIVPRTVADSRYGRFCFFSNGGVLLTVRIQKHSHNLQPCYLSLLLGTSYRGEANPAAPRLAPSEQQYFIPASLLGKLLHTVPGGL